MASHSLGFSDPAWVVRTVLVADLVESVRLFEQDTKGAVRRWQEVVDLVMREILPAHRGRLVKSLGDGFMLEFVQVRQAVDAAFEIQRVFNAANAGLPPEQQMLLRVGGHVGEVFVGDIDIFGHDVNIAARVMTLAGPGEIVVSAALRDQLTEFLDADIDDLGERKPSQVKDVLDAGVEYLGDCILKNLAEPVRAYRLGPPGPQPAIEPGSDVRSPLRPTIAVIPFAARGTDQDHLVLGEVLADDVISALSRTAELHVISRLSTTAFRDRGATLADIGKHLKVSYALSGAYRVSGRQLTLVVELAEVTSGRIVWTDSLKGQVKAILQGDDDLIDRIVARVSAEVLKRELERAQSEPLPTLQSYTLLMGAITLMHRGSWDAFNRAGEMLETLTTRSRRQAIPHAWLAKWHVLRYNRDPSQDQKRTALLARDCTKRALDAEPNCSFALTMDGFVHTNLLKEFDIAQDRYDLALAVNPNESLAWLLTGTLHAFKGKGTLAVECTDHALTLSPLDPLRYFYESLAATAAHSAGQYERAIELARKSLRSNRVHPSTLRALAIAQTKLGRIDDARMTVSELRKLQPTLTVKTYLESNPSGACETGEDWAEALRLAGLPE